MFSREETAAAFEQQERPSQPRNSPCAAGYVLQGCHCRLSIPLLTGVEEAHRASCLVHRLVGLLWLLWSSASAMRAVVEIADAAATLKLLR